MKLRIAHTALLVATILSSRLWAQPPPPRPDRPPPGPGGPPPIEIFFEVMRQRNPEEFERLRRLRETDPDAFREEIATRVHKEFERRGITMPPGDGHAPRSGLRGDRDLRRPRPGDEGDAWMVHSPELEMLERKARELADSVRSATSDNERAQRLIALRAEVARAFDLREQMRAERIKQMRERLEKVESHLAARRANRDAILDRRVSELIGEDTTSW